MKEVTQPGASDRRVGTGGIFVSSVALVVASSTLVTDFAGFVALGWGFAIALVLAFAVILPLALSAADVSIAYPKAGAIYHVTRSIIGGRGGAMSGLFLSFSCLGMFLFGAAGETTAGAYALRALCDSTLPVEVFVVVLAMVAVTPNLFGLRVAARLTGGLLVVMLGIRWFFGLAGFCGWAATGAWHAEHLMPAGGLHWFGPQGIVSVGLALGFWTFVGIEGACSLVEETKRPARALPRGLVLGLLAILATSLVMGVGATGTMPLSAWREAVQGAAGHAGESPQLAFGERMFGPVGGVLMALASLAATLSTLTVALAAVPRVLFAIARDGLFFGPLSSAVARVHPRSGVPVNATLLVVAAYLTLALCAGKVVDCLYSAAYLWTFRYVALHALALVNRLRHPERVVAFRSRWFLLLILGGIAGIVAAFHFGFAGRHLMFAPRALFVASISFIIAAVSCGLSRARDRGHQGGSAAAMPPGELSQMARVKPPSGRGEAAYDRAA